MHRYASLINSVETELQRKEHVVATILREEENRHTIARLRQDLKGLLVSKETDIQNKNSEIAQLKDQRQEAKARVNMENKCVLPPPSHYPAVIVNRGPSHYYPAVVVNRGYVLRDNVLRGLAAARQKAIRS